MAYYDICPKCGCNLDPGESCDCEQEREKAQEIFLKRFKTEYKSGQLAFNFDRKETYENKMCI